MSTVSAPAGQTPSPASSMSVPPHRPVRGAVLACGFGGVLAIWALGYLALLQPGFLLGEVIAILMAIALIGCGYWCARATGQGIFAGSAAGLVSALFNLLIVGSLLRNAPDDSIALWWVPAVLLGSITLGGIGGLIARLLGAKPRIADDRSLPLGRDYHAVFARLACGAVFLLLISGGIVTGTETGLAVPDWPNSFGHNMLLYPLTEMVSEEGRAVGVHYEHAHRLYGMLVGLTAIVLVVDTWLTDRRPWVRFTTLALLIMVCGQGLLGGLRVTDTNLFLALVHGIFAQIIFATICVVAAARSITWRFGAPAEPAPAAKTEQTLSAMLIAALIVQLALGAAYRHLSASESTASETAVTGLLHAHLAFAFLAVLPLALLAGLRCWGKYRDLRMVRRTGFGLTHLVGFQLLLGLVAFFLVLSAKEGTPIRWYEVAITTAHQATGALILAWAALLAAWTRRLLAPA